jgi:Ca-activated chloride channel homolog
MRSKGTTFLILIVVISWPLLTGFSLPGAFERLCSAGYRLFTKGDFGGSERHFEQAVKERPDDPTANFDYGTALYRGQKYQEALEAFGKAAKSTDPAMQQAAEYNLGNTAYRMQQLDQAIEHYKRSLCLNSADQEAKYNLEMALRQQQQKQQDKDKQQDKPDQKNQPQKQPEQSEEDKKNQLSKQEAERLLKSTGGDDEKLQRELRRAPTTERATRGKDW